MSREFTNGSIQLKRSRNFCRHLSRVLLFSVCAMKNKVGVFSGNENVSKICVKARENFEQSKVNLGFLKRDPDSEIPGNPRAKGAFSYYVTL